MLENESDINITSDFGSYDTIIPYDGDRNYMSMWNAIEFGDIEKAKELIDSGEEGNYSMFICDVHNVKMLEFLWDYGNFNLYDENGSCQELFAISLKKVMQIKSLSAPCFRNFLLDNGFSMIQYSIYSKLFSGKDACTKYYKMIQNNLPENGKVDIITITDKQYKNILSFYKGKKCEKKQKNSCFCSELCKKNTSVIFHIFIFYRNTADVL